MLKVSLFDIEGIQYCLFHDIQGVKYFPLKQCKKCMCKELQESLRLCLTVKIRTAVTTTFLNFKLCLIFNKIFGNFRNLTTLSKNLFFLSKPNQIQFH